MSQITYKVGDLRRIVAESTNEFKPMLGKGVETDDKKNAQETYKAAEKKANNYDGGLREPAKRELQPRMSGNKTTLGYDFDAEPSDQYKERVKAQAQGYTSTLEKDNGIEKAGDFKSDFYDNEKETIENDAKHREDIRTSGLVSRELKNKDPEYGKVHTAIKEEKKPIKRLTFKHTRFLNESQIFDKLPEEYKTNGNRVIVRDASSNEYLVEWCENRDENFSHGRIVKQRNLKEVNSQMDRINELFGYDSASFNKKNTVNEDTAVADMLNTVRNIIK